MLDKLEKFLSLVMYLKQRNLGMWYLRTFLLGGVFWLVGMTFLGCGSPTEPHFKDGGLYFVNNSRLWPGTKQRIYAVFEDRRREIDFNMDDNAELTGVGAVEISKGPLAGGTKVTVGCLYGDPGNILGPAEISLTIDGNMTVEAYETDWNSYQGDIALRFHRGIFNGHDPAAGSLKQISCEKLSENS
jgi:hypothetical protein